MSKLQFVKAIRTTTKIKMAITGPSGSGKTYSSLAIASGITSKIALLDTEVGSASLYSDIFDFDTLVISPPFTADKFIEAINVAEAAGYDLLIIDSLSHAWAGDGGALERKEQLDARGGRQNAYTNWGPVKKEQSRLKEAILQSKMHVICTLRAKQEHALSNENGKNKVQKLGMAPIAEPGAEYEYSILFELGMNHDAIAGKDRTGLFDGQILRPSADTGRMIKEWLNSSHDLLGEFKALATQATTGMTPEEKLEWTKSLFGEEMKTVIENAKSNKAYIDKVKQFLAEKKDFEESTN